MPSTFHITPEMMNTVLDRSFSSAVTQSDKAAARHLRDMLAATHSNYQSVVFDILQMAHSRDRALAEISFLIGMQAGYELGIAYPPPAAAAAHSTPS